MNNTSPLSSGNHLGVRYNIHPSLQRTLFPAIIGKIGRQETWQVWYTLFARQWNLSQYAKRHSCFFPPDIEGDDGVLTMYNLEDAREAVERKFGLRMDLHSDYISASFPQSQGSPQGVITMTGENVESTLNNIDENPEDARIKVFLSDLLTSELLKTHCPKADEITFNQFGKPRATLGFLTRIQGLPDHFKEMILDAILRLPPKTRS